jgi:hypothetical protein
MYILTTEIYKTNDKITTEFEKFGDAVRTAEYVAEVLNNVIPLTRHTSCETSISHCGYYADHYNELFICVKSNECKIRYGDEII